MWLLTATVENLFPWLWEPSRRRGTGVPIQRVVMPVTGIESWTVLGDDGAVVTPAKR